MLAGFWVVNCKKNWNNTKWQMASLFLSFSFIYPHKKALCMLIKLLLFFLFIYFYVNLGLFREFIAHFIILYEIEILFVNLLEWLWENGNVCAVWNQYPKSVSQNLIFHPLKYENWWVRGRPLMMFYFFYLVGIPPFWFGHSRGIYCGAFGNVLLKPNFRETKKKIRT